DPHRGYRDGKRLWALQTESAARCDAGASLAKGLPRPETPHGFHFLFERVGRGWYTEEEVSSYRPGGTFPRKDRNPGRRERLVGLRFSEKCGFRSSLCLLLHHQRPRQGFLERKTTRAGHLGDFVEPIVRPP